MSMNQHFCPVNRWCPSHENLGHHSGWSVFVITSKEALVLDVLRQP